MDLVDRERDRVSNLARLDKIGEFPDGPTLSIFDPLALAELLEQQATRAKLLYDVPKVDLRMDASDALKLVQVLRSLSPR